jgi:hypothetical protein
MTHEHQQTGPRLRSEQSQQPTELRERLATRLINRNIAYAEDRDGPITTSTARLIAACIHAGEDTALAAFAATGRLELDEAITEIDAQRLNVERLPWVSALWDYLESHDEVQLLDAELPQEAL